MFCLFRGEWWFIEKYISLRPFVGQLVIFFRIHSALCLDPQAGGKCAKRRVLCFLAALWAFAFRPLLGVR